MHSHDMAIMSSRALAAVIAVVIIALAVTACDKSYLGPDPAACKAAMQAEYVKATTDGGHTGAEPAACKGLPKAELQRFAADIRAGK
jgi:hypothetical protein